MNRLFILLLFISFFLSGFFQSCSDWEENYSTNPNHLLEFSVDILSFDTVFTTLGSATRQFMIYNHNSQPLNISSVQLADSERSGFRINVDGRSGENFSDITILEKDSLYVLVEVTVDPKNENNPFLIQDSVLFLTNGVTQYVRLQAYGQDVHIIKGGYTFSQDTILSSLRPYLVYDSIMIAEQVKVEVEPNTKFYMYDKAKWIVSGTLQINGERDAPVIFRGHRFDEVLVGTLPYDRIPGQWEGIIFRPESFNNVFEHTIIRNMVSGILLEESHPDELKIEIYNSQLTNSELNLFQATNCRVKATNTEFSNSGGGTMVLTGGYYEFIHCTLTNYMQLTSRYAPCLILSNELLTEDNITKDIPLLQAGFINSIIDGNFSDELELNVTESTGFEYEFNHCILKTDTIESSRFINVQFGKSPFYWLTGNRAVNYMFDFRLELTDDKENRNVAIGKADRSISEVYPIDRYGINRLNGEYGPDIGAYQYDPDNSQEVEL